MEWSEENMMSAMREDYHCSTHSGHSAQSDAS